MPAANDKTDVFKLYDMSGDNPSHCWKWNGAWGGRSRTLRPYFQFQNKRMIAYRVVYELMHGVILTSDQLIKHSCDNGGHPYGCACPTHISLGTHTENMEEMKLRQRHGLPRNVVKNVRRLLYRGTSLEDIAELYGMSVSNVKAIRDGVTYDHVGDEDA